MILETLSQPYDVKNTTFENFDLVCFGELMKITKTQK